MTTISKLVELGKVTFEKQKNGLYTAGLEFYEAIPSKDDALTAIGVTKMQAPSDAARKLLERAKEIKLVQRAKLIAVCRKTIDKDKKVKLLAKLDKFDKLYTNVLFN